MNPSLYPPDYPPGLINRDRFVTSFRHKVYEALEFAPFAHQAEWQLATEGFSLLPYEPEPNAPFLHIRRPDDQVVRRAYCERTLGMAKVAADLAAFKAGKSYCAAKWLTGFAALPNAMIHLVGLEYSTSEPEFNYLVDDLCSERGMNMKYDKLHNDPRGGRMILWLRTGAKYEVKSWNQKEALKGKKITTYMYTEAYQLPGLECFTSIAQNLRELRGWAVFPTTPDRPWVGVFHKYGHGRDPSWSCTCGVDGTVNPRTFSLEAMVKDAPNWELLPEPVRRQAKARGLEPGQLMTREKFSIAHLGMMGKFVGSVYEFQMGTRLLTPTTHPYCWRDGITKLDHTGHANA